MAITIDTPSCVGCGACITACPLDLIILSDGMSSIADEGSCIECGSCVDACPLGIITL